MRRPLLSMIVASMLSACTWIGVPPGGNPAPAPTYAVGDSFTLDNPPVTWSVAALQGGLVLWSSDAGDEMVTAFNPFVPPLEWAGEREGSGKLQLTEVVGELFPLKPGNRMSFSVTGEGDRPPRRFAEAWECVVGDAGTTTVPSGRFDTIGVTCTGPAASRRFDYAPGLGFPVQRSDRIGSDDVVVRRLTAYARDSESDRRGPPTTLHPDPVSAAELDRLRGEVARLEGALGSGRLVASAAPPGRPSVDGRWAVRLAAYRNEPDAARGWQLMKRRFPDLLGPMQPIYRTVDLPGRGRFLRVFAGPLRDRAAADQLCRSLKARSLDFCLPEQPGA